MVDCTALIEIESEHSWKEKKEMSDSAAEVALGGQSLRVEIIGSQMFWEKSQGQREIEYLRFSGEYEPGLSSPKIF